MRVPSHGYRLNSALIRADPQVGRLPAGDPAWREAAVLAGSDWRLLAANLAAALTPAVPGHGAYYQAFLADGVFYRDATGAPRFASPGTQPAEVVVDRRWTAHETLEQLARLVDQNLARTHPERDLFLLMAPSATQGSRPLLLDRRLHRCVSLAPAALFDSTERGLSPALTVRGAAGLLLDSHGWGLVRTPVSSAARLIDLGAATVLRCLRWPFLSWTASSGPPASASGMDLAAWERWLDRETGTRCEPASLQLLIDGPRFFPRFRAAVDAATNRVDVQVYIFDRDDVAVGLADQLKARAARVPVRVMFDQLGSLAAGATAREAPLPAGFSPPASILDYLRAGSRVRVRPTLNPWFTSDHSKILVVDGVRAWVGGMNLGREYESEWHDLMVEVEGPLVGSLEHDFDLQWAHTGPFGDLAYAAKLGETPPVAAPEPGAQRMAVRRLPTRTFWKPLNSALVGALRRAQSALYAENPYLFDSRVVEGLVAARARGVDVRVVLPRANDFKGAARSNLITANYLLAHGVRVYFYPGMTHVKALYADGWVCLGSGNYDHLSLQINHEQNLATSDPRFATTVRRELFEEDFTRSYELTEPVSVEWGDFLADTILANF